MARLFTAKKVKITADEISKPSKHRETSTHNAQRTVAKGDVEVEVLSQYPRKDGDSERPSEGSIIKGDHADMTAREVHLLGKNSGRTSATMKDNVHIKLRNLKSRRSR